MLQLPEEPTQQEEKEDDSEPPQPPAGGGIQDLEMKLKEFIKAEVQKACEEFQDHLQEERGKRMQLEEMVIAIMGQMEHIQRKLQS